MRLTNSELGTSRTVTAVIKPGETTVLHDAGRGPVMHLRCPTSRQAVCGKLVIKECVDAAYLRASVVPRPPPRPSAKAEAGGRAEDRGYCAEKPARPVAPEVQARLKRAHKSRFEEAQQKLRYKQSTSRFRTSCEKQPALAKRLAV